MTTTDPLDVLQAALRIHHPIMRSETGPLSGCRCGQVRLGQDVIAHVVAELRAALEPAVSGTPDTTTPAVTEEDWATADRRELQSRVYEWLGRRTSMADGDEWDHGHLRDAAEELTDVVVAAECGKADALRAAMHALAEDIRCGTFGHPPAVSVLAARLRTIADGQR